MLTDFTSEYARYGSAGERAVNQVSDEGLNRIIGADNNSIAMRKLAVTAGGQLSGSEGNKKRVGYSHWRTNHG